MALLIRKVAQSLFYDVGLRRGDTILILSNNRAEYIFVVLAAALIGVVVSTASPLYTESKRFNSKEYLLFV